ncbi:sulfatase-like hydrolase/transferase [Coraliomargarita sp. W4R53]
MIASPSDDSKRPSDAKLTPQTKHIDNNREISTDHQRSKSTAIDENKTNYIIILADDLGYGDIGAYRDLYPGQDNRAEAYKHTPNLDRLAEQGIRFTRAYATGWCSPSRQVLLSGQWVGRADAYNHPWIGAQLRESGYTTGMVGKSHGAKAIEKIFHNLDQESAEFDDGLFFNGGARHYYTQYGETFPGRKQLTPFAYSTKKDEYLMDIFTDHAVDFIQRNAHRPFMLYLAYTAPHGPFEGKPEDLKKLYPDTFASLSDDAIRATAKQQRNPEMMDMHYTSLVYGMDRDIGRVVATLSETGNLDNTVIIFASDNGSVQGSNYPLTGHKWDGLEGGLRVPFIIWSQKIAQSGQTGTVVDDLVSLADISATIVEDATGDYQHPTDGMALMPYLLEGRAWPDEREYLVTNACYEHQNTGAAEFNVDLEGRRLMQYIYYRNDQKLLVWNKQGSDAVGANYRRIPEVTGDQTAATQLQEKTPVAGQIPVEGPGRALLDTMIERVNQNPGELLASWSGASSHDQENFNWWFQDHSRAASKIEEPQSSITERVSRDESPLVHVKLESATEVEIGRDYRFELGGELGLDLVWTADLDGWVGKYEVTNAQYRKLKSGHNSGTYKEYSLDGDSQPVVQVSYDDAIAYVDWLNDQFRENLPSGYRFSLPGRKEWLKYAQCGDGRKYPWGNEWPPKYGNYDDETTFDAGNIAGYRDGYMVSAPVEQSGRNGWGLYGIAGNVWEWTMQSVENSRVVRGASWRSLNPQNLSVNYRYYYLSPAASHHCIGFRVILCR